MMEASTSSIKIGLLPLHSKVKGIDIGEWIKLADRPGYIYKKYTEVINFSNDYEVK